MLPHKHFLIAAIVIIPIALILKLSFGVLLEWVIVGGVISAFIDVDSLCLLTFTKDLRLKRFRSIKAMFAEYDDLIDTLIKTGKLRFLSLTHSMISIAIVVLAIFFFSDYLVPALVGVISHLLSDLRYI